MSSKIPVSDEAMKKLEEEYKREAKKHEALASLVKLVRKKKPYSKTDRAIGELREGNNSILD